MKEEYKTIDEYIKLFPKDVQNILEKIRQIVHRAVPEGVEAISYEIPTVKLNGKNLVHFAGWKNHISIYPVPYGSKAFQKELSPYITGKGTIQFPLNKPIPFDLVERIVDYLVGENINKKKQKNREK